MASTQGRETGSSAISAYGSRQMETNSERVDITPEKIRAALRDSPPDIETGESRFRRAAVIVPIIWRQEPAILFTRRTEHLPSHAGQICFPGGGYAPTDETLMRTALRELQEEIGLPPESVTVAGFLDAYDTLNTGFRILPVVGFLENEFQLTINTDEVAEVFEAPVSFLIDPRNHALKYAKRGGVMREFFSITFEQHEIWGATAAMIVNLSERLRQT
jgi:8-oxo-dGTP pyrophosphatase MutT (NUDIX family)